MAFAALRSMRFGDRGERKTMAYKSFHILKLCLIVFGTLLPIAGFGSRQFAYVSSVDGIYQYRINQRGVLKLLSVKPVQDSPGQSQLLVDADARMLYAIDSRDSNKVYLYHIKSSGKLLPARLKSFSVPGVETAMLDVWRHQMILDCNDYLISRDSEVLLIYNVQNPRWAERYSTTLLPARTPIEVMLSSPNKHVILVGRRVDPNGRPPGSRLLQYVEGDDAHVPLRRSSDYSTGQWISAATFASCYLVAGGWDNILDVYTIEKTGLRTVSSLSAPKSAEGDFLAHIVYRSEGSLLFVSSYSLRPDSSSNPPASAVATYHLRSNGQLRLLKTKATYPLPNPALFLDKTGRFLYVTSEVKSTIDAYKVTHNGRLTIISHLQVPAPTEMAFFSNM